MSASHPIVDVHGFRMRLNSEDRAVSAVIAEERTWEPLETRLIEGRVGKGSVVVDVGANIGYYTLLLSQIVGEGGHVFAFEPEPTNFALLTENVWLNDRENVTLVNAAVADISDPQPLYLAGENKGDHRLFDSPEETRDSVLVDVVRLDAYFAEYPRALDLVKIDTQGSEGAVIEGMRSLLERNRDIELLLEFWPEGLRTFGTDPAVFLASLTAKGFALYHIDRAETVALATSQQLLDKCRSYTTVFCTRKSVEPEQLLDYERYRRALPPDAATRWAQKITTAVQEIEPVVSGQPYLLVDGGEFGPAFPVNAIPFLERNGVYWGPPADGASAVAELERMRRDGAQFVAFAWNAFWWLDCYSELLHHLRLRYLAAYESPNVRVFDLRKQGRDHAGPPTDSATVAGMEREVASAVRPKLGS